MTLEDKIMEFTVFCIESASARLGEKPENLYLKLDQLNLIKDYIVRFYDTLHTQSKEYIVDEILEAMKHREEKGGEVC